MRTALPLGLAGRGRVLDDESIERTGSLLRRTRPGLDAGAAPHSVRGFVRGLTVRNAGLGPLIYRDQNCLREADLAFDRRTNDFSLSVCLAQ